jgi:hypothetical protein
MKIIIHGKERETTQVKHEGHTQYAHEVDGINFDGHYVLWGFSYEPETYLKESELSGEEWRKGGTIRYFKNGIQVYEEFCREPHVAILKIGTTLLKLQEVQWDKLKEGEKIYWYETPAIIRRVITEQGAMIVVPEEGHTFPDPVWAEEEWQKLEDRKEVKIDIFDPHLWWWRK